MMWRVRASVTDQPGALAETARACGEASVNIVSLQVYHSDEAAIDDFVVTAPPGMNDVQLAEVFASAGASHVSATRCGDGAISDTATRYLNGVHEVLEKGRAPVDVLTELLDLTPPDVADYTGHDHLELKKRNGSVITIARAIPFTPEESERAQVFLSLVSDAGIDVPLVSPSQSDPIPLIRVGALSDIEHVAALHQRCSAATLYNRYQVPLRMPMTTRMTRRLLFPETGVSIVAQVGDSIVGHSVLEFVDNRWTFQLLVEDAWQGHGLGSMLVKEAAGRAKGLGAEHLTFVTVGANDTLLRTVGRAGFVARVERHDGNVYITVPLTSVYPIEN